MVTAPPGATATTRIDGFTITNGAGTGSSPFTYGGGLYLAASSPTIANNTITNNNAGNGGGLYLEESSPTIANNTITGNSAGDGGGLYLRYSSPTIENNRMTKNRASYGGGLYAKSSFPTIVNNTITGNKGSSGGGLHMRYCSPMIANNTIADNSALDGGALYLYYSSSPMIAGNTITANSAASGGGLYLWNSSPVIANTIVAFNSSGIHQHGASSSTTLRYSCVHGNAAYDYDGLTDPTGTRGNISVDPLFADLRYGNVHIQPDSPCVDAGSNADAPGDFDMDGEPRIQPLGGTVDIGADESDRTVWSSGPYVIVRVSPIGDDANGGSTWALAKRTVQAGIDTASALGGEVWVQADTYHECITLHPYAYVYGGFAGKETMREERDWYTNVTTMDGQQQGSVVTALAGEDVSAIDGFTITNGRAARAGGVYLELSSPTIANNTITGNRGGNGGGVRLEHSHATIAGNTITRNRARLDGGGLLLSASSPTITNNTVTGNSAGDYGGGLFLFESSPTIAQNTITGNGASYGGGLYFESSAPTIANNTITGNTADHEGGGLYNRFGTLIIVDSHFDRNFARYGGGIFSYDGDVASMRCLFTENVATIAGAGMYSLGTGTALAAKSVFRANWAQMGGAIYTSYAALVLTDCVLFANSAYSGGAVYSHGAQSALRNCRFSYNSVTQVGGAFYSAVYSLTSLASCTFSGNSARYGSALALWRQSSVDMGNTILWGEAEEIWGDDDCTVAITYSNVRGGWPGVGNIDADPLFADPDGPDDIPGTEDDDFRLAAGSPCIDAGDNDAVPATVTTDLDGNPRFLDDPVTRDTGEPGAIGPPVVDMGAYEYQPVRLDILPGQCPNHVNMRSHRVVAVAIVGTPGFDVTQVDLESLTLRRTDGAGDEVFPLASRQGVHSTLRDAAATFAGDLCECHTDRRDGLDDLVLKFSVSDMVDLLELDDAELGRSIMLTLSGNLIDATPFEASDCIVVGGPRNAQSVAHARFKSAVATRMIGDPTFDTEVKLTASDATIEYRFGSSVGISEDTVIVGAPNSFAAGLFAGSAYIFQRDKGGAVDWREVTILTASDAGDFEFFGSSVAISGDTAIVGARGDRSGAAYIFQWHEHGRNEWEEVAKLTASDAEVDDRFGYSLAIEGDTAIVGAWGNSDAGDTSGSAYVFQRDEGGRDAWGEVVKLTASDAGRKDRFGLSVGISGDTAIVGAYGDNDAGGDSGSAYVFRRDEGGPGNWGEEVKLTASDAARGASFGWSVAISRDVAIVGAGSGSAYVFHRVEGGVDDWDEVAKLTASDAASGDWFGYKVSVSGDTAIVAASRNDDAGRNSGSAYIFRRDEGGTDNWGEVMKLTASDAAMEDEFGTSVAISGDTAIAGVPEDDDAGRDSGSAYVFFSSAKPGRMTGGGNVFDGAVRFTHSFGLPCEPDGGAAKLTINWRGNRFHLTELDSAWCSDDSNIDESPPVAGFDTFEGTGTGVLNGVSGVTITFTLTDAGEPGRGVDYAEFVIQDEGQPIVLTGTLLGGNHQAHRR